jgi:hypothetical protein
MATRAKRKRKAVGTTEVPSLTDLSAWCVVKQMIAQDPFGVARAMEAATEGGRRAMRETVCKANATTTYCLQQADCINVVHSSSRSLRTLRSDLLHVRWMDRWMVEAIQLALRILYPKERNRFEDKVPVMMGDGSYRLTSAQLAGIKFSKEPRALDFIKDNVEMFEDALRFPPRDEDETEDEHAKRLALHLEWSVSTECRRGFENCGGCEPGSYRLSDLCAMKPRPLYARVSAVTIVIVTPQGP